MIKDFCEGPEVFVEIVGEAIEAWRFVIFHIVDGVSKFGGGEGFYYYHYLP